MNKAVHLLKALSVMCLALSLFLGVGCGADQEPLEPDMSALEPDMSALEPDMSALEPDMSALEPDMSALEPDMSALEPDMSALEPDMSAPDMALPVEKSEKRGIASALRSEADLEALSRGVSWWYNWSPRYNEAGAGFHARGDMGFVPMTWNGNNPDQIRAFLSEHPEVRYLLTFNEPNFQSQANLTPAYAASLWPTFEMIADEFNVELVGPAVNYCGDCVVVDGSPIESPFTVWMDMFFESFRAQFGREPRMEYTALHWYDYGLEMMVEEMVTRYERPVWLTEFALWRTEDWCTDEVERQWLIDMVAYLEAHPMVARYAWFTARRPDFPKINLLGADGELTPLGEAYVNAPY